jgi:Peptidase family C25/Propeptide_C25
MEHKKLLFCTLIIILANAYCFSQSKTGWIAIDKNSPADSKPQVILISSDENGAVIKVDLPGYRLKEFTADGKIYNSINIGDEAVTTDVGLPEIPYIAKILAIPDQGIVNVEVLETGKVHRLNGITVPPARESWLEGKPESPYVENTNFYSSQSIYPQEFVRAEDPIIFRDFRLARISIYPIRYSPLKKEIEAVTSITVRVSYSPGIGINPKLTPKRMITPSFNKLYRSFIFNYKEVLQQRYDGLVGGHDKMLCIMPDMYIEEFQPYADWKNRSGTEIVVTKFSDIGANYSNPQPIKDYILSVYNTWAEPPTHILIVGDYGTVNGCAPRKTITYNWGGNWTFADEDWFVELEGNDYFPEMMIGRFTNHGTGGEYRLQVMVNKFMSYEKPSPGIQGDWYKKAVVCSNNEYQSQIETKRFAAQEMTNYGGFTVDTMMSQWPYGCPYNLNNVIGAINEGRGFLNYRGEGWYYGWWASCYQFETSDVSNLSNFNKLAFVTSIGCGVAMFDASEQSFGEEWIEMGTLTAPPRGACAFIGPTSNTHTAYNNEIDKGIYIGMFQEGMDSPGEALLRGKFYMYQVFGNILGVEYHYRIYCVLGDPSIHIWKSIPRQVIVTNPNEVYVGYNQVHVTVVDSITGFPITNARICISGNGVYAIDTTDISGNATIGVTCDSVGTLYLTVCGGNVIPNEKTIQVSIGTENVTPNGKPAITDLDGNNDGLIDPNENCTITFALKNWGTISSNGVYAILSVPGSETNVEINTDSVYFGDIAPNDSITGAPFEFFIKPECPVSYIIPFQLHVASSTSSWDYNYNEIVHGCKLHFNEFFVDDEGNVLHNYRMDPGETVKVKFKIQNTGDDIAPDVTGILSTNDPYMTILDSTAAFGTILPDSNAINESGTYIITVSDDCPVQYNANFSLELLTHNGLYPYSMRDSIILPVAMPSALDPTGPDIYGYYAYSSNDVLWEQHPVFNWIELDGIGTELQKPSNLNYFRQVVNLPFTFKYYGENFSAIGVNGDGWIAFSGDTLTKSLNNSLPSIDSIHGMCAIFWDDLFSNLKHNSGKLIYYSDTDNHRFIAEWSEVPHCIDTMNVETFQIILLDPNYYQTPTGDGEIIFQYKQVEEPGSCTIGIENDSENIALQYLFNENYDPTANILVNNLAIKFTTKAPTLTEVGNEREADYNIPTKYSLDQNYPNPFNPATTISYSIPKAGHVKIMIFNINAQLVKILIDGNKLAGRYETMWDGTNNFGSKVSSGVYFYRLQSGSFLRVKKMVLLK